MSSKHNFSIVTTARWEEEDVAEWILYHLALGFDHIYLYSNDDDPSALRKAVMPFCVGKNAPLTLKHFPKLTSDPQQHLVYYHFLENHKEETEWFTFLDVDEFYVLPGCNNISEYVRPFVRSCDAIYFNWVIYGHGGRPFRSNASILLNYVLRDAAIDPHTKVLTRSSSIDLELISGSYRHGIPGFWHFWDQYPVLSGRFVNVLNEDMSKYSQDFPTEAYRYIRQPGIAQRILATGYIAHFQFKSEADFIRRVRRGGSLTAPLWDSMVKEGAHLHFAASRGNLVRDTYLSSRWRAELIQALDLVAGSGEQQLYNAALYRPSFQSSIGEISDPYDGQVCDFANNGVITHRLGAVTREELEPWWCIDLIEPARPTAIRIYAPSSCDIVHEPKRIVVSISMDGDTFSNVQCQVPKSGVSLGSLLRVDVALAPLVPCRFLRLSISGHAVLRLSEVEVLIPYNPSAPLTLNTDLGG